MRLLTYVCLCVIAVGCGDAGQYYAETARCASEESRETSMMAAPTPTAAQADELAAEPAGAAVTPGAVAETAMRPKIIYTAEVSLVVEDFAATEQALRELIASHSGYVAESSAQRTEGVARSGRWVIRVPTGRYDTFLGGLDRIGYIDDRRQTAADVTAEFIDIQARVTNLKRLEERLIDLLENRNGKLDELLTIEQELARVRGEVEQAEGRLRYLTNKTDFSTVTVLVREEQDYVPPQAPPPAPTFTQQIATTWGHSIDALRRTAERAVLALVAAVPWLGVLAVPALCLFLVVGIAQRKSRARPDR